MKKRILSLLLALVLLFGLLPVTARADMRLDYKILENGLDVEILSRDSDWSIYVCVMGCTGDAAEIVVPAEVDGFPVEVIAGGCFSDCEHLVSVSIPSSVTEINDSFYNCSNLTGIYVDENNSNYCNDHRGVLFNKEKTALLTAPNAIADSYEIPDSVIYINRNAFLGCSNLSSVIIPNSVTSIDWYAFQGCSNLSSVIIPDSVTSINGYAFSKCSSLNSVVISNSVTSIGLGAFSYCSSLNTIVIPSSVTSIGEEAFACCSGLTSIRFEGDAPDSSYYPIFYDVTATAYYPAGNPTWTEDTMACYGGNITWVPYCTDSTHEYTAVVTTPTCTEQGYTTYTCACGDSYVQDYVDALGHDYADGICIRCGEADPSYEKPIENPFTDVPAGAFYEEAVLWALENGITTGATADTFNPGGTCLRAQVVTFLHRAAESPEPASSRNPFTDVKSSDFFYKPVLWAVEKGITNGVSATEFGSYANCNRAAVVTFLWRAAGSPEPVSTSNPFSDVKSTDFFYKPVLWAIENGITNGLSVTEFGPTAACNRAQVVTFLYRAYN